MRPLAKYFAMAGADQFFVLMCRVRSMSLLLLKRMSFFALGWGPRRSDVVHSVSCCYGNMLLLHGLEGLMLTLRDAWIIVVSVAAWDGLKVMLHGIGVVTGLRHD